MCRSRRELSNAYLLAKFGFDTAENEPLKVHLLSHYPALGFNFHQATPPHRAGQTVDSLLCVDSVLHRSFESESLVMHSCRTLLPSFLGDSEPLPRDEKETKKEEKEK